DHLANGGTRAVSIVDSEGGTVPDDDQLNGRVRETITYNGSGGPVLGATITDPWQRGPTAVHGSLKAWMVDVGTVRGRTSVSGGGWRRTQVDRSYNADGLVTQIDDQGDLADATQRECTRTWYARNDATWLISLPSRVESVAASCGATPAYPAQAISDVR